MTRRWHYHTLHRWASLMMHAIIIRASNAEIKLKDDGSSSSRNNLP